MTQTRTLILGFDGGDREVFDAFDMPFLENLIYNAIGSFNFWEMKIRKKLKNVYYLVL